MKKDLESIKNLKDFKDACEMLAKKQKRESEINTYLAKLIEKDLKKKGVK